jgi:hypothetical protein
MDVKFNLKGIDNILKALKDQRLKVRVGIMGNEASAMHPGDNGESSGKTNAEIGAIHEDGRGHNPVRSFLRVPLSKNLPNAIRMMGPTSRSEISEMIQNGSFEPLAERIGTAGVAIVLEAFDSGGADGEWPPSDMSRKKNHQTLIETQQLRDSITYKVVRGG